jgi:hypothetical protein
MLFEGGIDFGRPWILAWWTGEVLRASVPRSCPVRPAPWEKSKYEGFSQPMLAYASRAQAERARQRIYGRLESWLRQQREEA